MQGRNGVEIQTTIWVMCDKNDFFGASRQRPYNSPNAMSAAVADRFSNGPRPQLLLTCFVSLGIELHAFLLRSFRVPAFAKGASGEIRPNKAIVCQISQVALRNTVGDCR
jgi:hypothetical protein